MKTLYYLVMYLKEVFKDMIYKPTYVKSTVPFLDLPPSTNHYSVLARGLVSSNPKIKQFDIFTIWMVIKVIWEVIKCYLKKQMLESDSVKLGQNPNFFHRYMLRKIVKRVVKENKNRANIVGSKFEFTDDVVEQLCQDMLKLGKVGTIGDLSKLKADFEETRRICQ